jgi:UDP-2,3-diacylglucosamine pyrophosphatase LpxH
MIPADQFLDAVLNRKIDNEPIQPRKYKLPKDGKNEVIRFRTIWISDLHLGTTGCQAARLLEFLHATESDTLYLVGDIIDGWQLKRRWYWDQIHNNVVQTVLKKAKKGTNVIFVPGNHDEAVRQFIDLDFGGIKIRDELVHVTAKGKKMLVLHGDRFDGVIACAKWLAYVGDGLYTMILKFNQVFNHWRARCSDRARDGHGARILIPNFFLERSIQGLAGTILLVKWRGISVFNFEFLFARQFRRHDCFQIGVQGAVFVCFLTDPPDIALAYRAFELHRGDQTRRHLPKVGLVPDYQDRFACIGPVHQLQHGVGIGIGAKLWHDLEFSL